MTRDGGGRLLLLAGLVCLLAVSGCSGGEATTTTPTPTPTPATTTPSPTPTPLSPGAEAAALAAAGPRSFDAEYRLAPLSGVRAALVRVRVTPRRYRVDVTHGGRTASLLSGRAGVVSCQTDSSGQTCLLVAKQGMRPPRLFDPGVQRLFVTAVPLLRDRRHGVTVERAGVWRAPRPYGPAQCFQVSGRLPDPGVYCFLEAGRWRGVLARAEFASGTLSLRHVDSRFPDSSFRPPVHPTPLPG